SKKYTNPYVELLESKLPERTATIRGYIYEHLNGKFNSFNCQKRRHIASDLNAPTIFDSIKDSKALFMPAYNPETQWCVMRNTIRVSEFPELGEDATVDLIEKNWILLLMRTTISCRFISNV
ncbi:MAG: hypothetical protein ABEI86_02200, partial [Halobacteriaceae archaeon]